MKWSIMYGIEKFDLIVKIDGNEATLEPEEIAIEKLKTQLKNQDPYFYLKECEFDNIFMVELKGRMNSTTKLSNALPKDNFQMVPIENVVLTRPEVILENILRISAKKIKDEDTFAIRCNIKGSKFIKKRETFIKSIYKEIEKINGKADEIHPDWIIHIEVLGENTGISVINQRK